MAELQVKEIEAISFKMAYKSSVSLCWFSAVSVHLSGKKMDSNKKDYITDRKLLIARSTQTIRMVWSIIASL